MRGSLLLASHIYNLTSTTYSMRVLYHFPLCPFSRQLRIILKEKDLSFELKMEHYWERRREFARLNPAMEVPVLVETEGVTLAEPGAICEYLEEVYHERPFIYGTPAERAEIRRLAGWFGHKFYQEVTRYVTYERIIRYYTRTGGVNSEALRVAKMNLYTHLDYIGFLVKQHKWLMGENLSLADIVAASQLSVLDYFGDVPWEHNPLVKEWYAVIKSRPSFRPLLADRISGYTPASHYTNLDF